MDSTLPVAVPSPYKSRRGWLLAFGVIEILMGCLFLLMILFSAYIFFGPPAAKMASGAMAAGPMSPHALLAFAGLQYGLMAAVFITAGIGSIRCRNWARILMLVVSSLWLGIGILGAIAVAVIFPIFLRQQPVNVPPGILSAVMVVMGAFMIFLMVLLPGVFLFFYSRKSVRATCLAQNAAHIPGPGAEETLGQGFPVPLAILGALQALGALTVFSVLFMRVVFVFGVVVHGAAAVLFFLTFSVLSGYAAWAIFRKKLIGWKIGLFITGLGVINGLVTYLRHPDMLHLFREMGYSEQMLNLSSQFPQFQTIFSIGSIVVASAYLVFVLYTRKFFAPRES